MREVPVRLENIRAADLAPGVQRPTFVGDPGLYPGADTMSRKLSRGFSAPHLLGSAGIFMTREGEDAVRDHFRDVIRRGQVDMITTPTWNTSPNTFRQVEGNPHLPSGMSAERTTRRGVGIVLEALEAEDSDATVLLSVRPTGNTVDGAGTLRRGEARRMFANQMTWLLEATGSRPSVLTLETAPTLSDASAFADVAREFEHPYIVMLRPNDHGRMPDGSSYAKVAEEVAGPEFVGGGFNCQTIPAIESAINLARRQGAEALTFAAVPNGAQGFNENLDGGLTDTEVRQIEAENIYGLKRLKEQGTFIIAGCCNSTTDDIVTWQEALNPDTSSTSRVREQRVVSLLSSR